MNSLDNKACGVPQGSIYCNKNIQRSWVLSTVETYDVPSQERLALTRSKSRLNKCFQGHYGVLKRVPKRFRKSSKRVLRDFSKWDMILLVLCWYSFNTFPSPPRRGSGRRPPPPFGRCEQVPKEYQKSTNIIMFHLLKCRGTLLELFFNCVGTLSRKL